MYDLKKLKFCCQKIIPLVYDNSLSIYELVCKVVEYLNETISNVETLSSDVDGIKEYVDNYFDNLNLYENVEQIINEMKNNGELESIVQQSINAFKGEIKPLRKWRVLTRYEEQPAFLQGCCKTPNGFLFCYYDNTLNTNNNVIKEFSENGTLLRTKSVSLGHCNGVCYNPINQKLYIAPHSDTASNPVLGLVEFNYSDLSEVRTVLTDKQFNSCQFDCITNKMYVAQTNGRVSEVINYDTFELVYKFTYNINYNTSTALTMQNCSVHNNRYYVLTVPNTLRCWDLNGNVIQNYTFPTFCSVHALGEIEGIDFDTDDNMYIFSITGTNRPSYYISQTFVWNLNKQVINDNFVSSRIIPRNVYVKSSQTSNNPDGSANNPFTTWSEAYIAIKATNAIREAYLEGEHDEVLYFDNDSLSIHGQNSTFRYMFIYNADVYIQNIILNSYEESPYYSIYSVNSNLYIADSVINASPSAPNVIKNYYGTISIQGNLTFTNVEANSYHLQNHSSNKYQGVDGRRNLKIYCDLTGSGLKRVITPNATTYTVNNDIKESILKNAYNYCIINLVKTNSSELHYLSLSGISSTQRIYASDGSTVTYDPTTGTFNSSSQTINKLIFE